MTAREEIGRLQRRLFERQRKLIATSVLGQNAEFRAYEQRYLRRTRDFLRQAGYAELLDAVAQADVVYVGDYHTLKQSQRSFLKLLQRRWPRRPPVVALEFVQGRHQRALDAWLAGTLDDARFLRAIEYRRHSIFDTWENFRPILDEARKRSIPVVGIDRIANGRTSLAERDRYAAARIVDALRPGAQLLVLAGQLHVAPPHLPEAVAREAARRGLPAPQPLVVYQNCERIWWALQRAGRELDADAAVVRPGEWCLINTPPVVVQQSYLDWIEGGEQPLESGHLERRFRLLARTVARFLGVDSRELRGALDDVRVYTAGNLSFVRSLRGFTRRERQQIEAQILSRESYYIPRANVAYLANLSINHAAEEATHFVRHVVSGADDEERGLVDAFYARALEEAYAFCGSKIVNPRRKCPHEPELERLARSRDARSRTLARLTLLHRQIEAGAPGLRSLRNVYGVHGTELFNAVTHTLGYMLGDRLYSALATGRMLKREVRELFLDPLDDEGQAFLTYMELSRKLRDVRIPRRV
jgi:hypothetical protein